MPAGEAEDPAEGPAGDPTAGEAAGDPPPATRKRPRGKPKTAARAMARAAALGAVAGTEGLAELAALRRSVDQLVQGLNAMLQTQAVHTEQLRALLAAATAPVDPDSELLRALEYISIQIADQGARTAELQSTMTRLPDAVAAAIGAQLAAALDAVR